jgi:anti-sigma factor RsiW
MTCNEHQENISSFVDGELDDPMAGALFTHLAGCAECRAFFARLHALRHQLSLVPRFEVPESLDSRMTRISNRQPARVPALERWIERLLKGRVLMPIPALAAILILVLATSLMVTLDRETPAQEPRVVYIMGLEPVEVFPNSVLNAVPIH